MWVSTQSFHVPKKGGSETEYEDASYPEASFESDDLTTYRCAVADGATESAFSREWAQLLVRGFGQYQFRLDQQQRLWRSIVTQKPLPWYLESKIGRGAHAAFVGLSLRDRSSNGTGSDEETSGTWRAFAIGDSCLFHVRENELLLAAPLTRSEEFGNNPYLLSTSTPGPIARGDPSVEVFSGSWQPNDAFYLATDAMAQWMLSEQEASRPPWSFLRDLNTSVFEPIVSVLRGTGRLHNDDTTLLRIEVS